MNNLSQYILEKLHLNKNIKNYYNNNIFNTIENIIKDYFSKSKLKYTINLLDIQKQSLYTRSDWGDGNFLRLEFSSNLTEDRFKKITLDIKDLIDKENIYSSNTLYIRKGSFLPQNGKRYGNKYIDYLIKKNEEN